MSGMKNAPTVMMMAGIPAQPRENRHPFSPILDPNQFTIVATSAPPLRKDWKAVVNAPRHFGGAISATYIGAACVRTLLYHFLIKYF